MKIAVECKSPLLQKSLEIFLVKYLSSKKLCDIVIRDEECLNDSRCFYISSHENADLLKPFSKSQLILALESKYGVVVKTEVVDEEALNFDILEKRIHYLTEEYKRNILETVKVFYEK